MSELAALCAGGTSSVGLDGRRSDLALGMLGGRQPIRRHFRQSVLQSVRRPRPTTPRPRADWLAFRASAPSPQYAAAHPARSPSPRPRRAAGDQPTFLRQPVAGARMERRRRLADRRRRRATTSTPVAPLRRSGRRDAEAQRLERAPPKSTAACASSSRSTAPAARRRRRDRVARRGASRPPMRADADDPRQASGEGEESWPRGRRSRPTPLRRPRRRRRRQKPRRRQGRHAVVAQADADAKFREAARQGKKPAARCDPDQHSLRASRPPRRP